VFVSPSGVGGFDPSSNGGHDNYRLSLVKNAVFFSFAAILSTSDPEISGYSDPYLMH
jgi:hypothetical protein